MLKVLLVDSWLLNNKVIEQDTQVYFDKQNIDYEFFECSNPEETMDILNNHTIDIAYIDISSEKFDGLQLLKDIKDMKIRQPKIVAVTVLYDKKYRYEALKLNVYRYIYKPYDGYEIQESLEKLFNDNNYSLSIQDYVKKLENEEVNETEDSGDDGFIDFDEFDEFEEFDEFDEFEDFEEEGIAHSTELMDAYNQSHKKITSEEFLAEYEDIGIDTDRLDDLEEDFDALIASMLYDDINDRLPDIIDLLDGYNKFVFIFNEFEELHKVIFAIIKLLEETDFSTMKRKDMAVKFIIAILEDLVDWREHVFVLQDAVDVYYINASILNSYVLLKDIINK